MRETEKQDCPLCSSEAEYYGVDFGNVKYFNCPSCSYFQISRRAEKHVIEAPQWLRDQLLDQVKQTPENHLLVIKITPGNGTRDDGGENLQGIFVPKSELSL
ncbi:MAG TPA: hypothetical protein VFN01_02400 [Marinobacter sp.]|uniref:hypothetical protein n=1 Tax=Marinobacter sp. TaxID=50741 RepID=UPI002D7FF40F|nr:hypothetical protein [Marinobacter sp.]HET8800011.1 hypothetical protein [Marinobacter sp.]